MPIYDYRCSACDHLVEVIHGLNDRGPRYCESCGAEGTMRKGVSTPAVLYKGSGWARKDRAASRHPTSPSGGEGKAGEGKAGEGKTGDGPKKSDDGDAASAAGSSATPTAASTDD